MAVECVPMVISQWLMTRFLATPRQKIITYTPIMTAEVDGLLQFFGVVFGAV
jgi:hypothetical protein